MTSSVPLSRGSEPLGRAGTPPKGRTAPWGAAGTPSAPTLEEQGHSRGTTYPPAPPKEGGNPRKEHGFPPQRSNGPAEGAEIPSHPPQKRAKSSEGHQGSPPSITGTPLERAGIPFLGVTATCGAQGPLLHPPKAAVTPKGPPRDTRGAPQGQTVPSPRRGYRTTHPGPPAEARRGLGAH